MLDWLRDKPTPQRSADRGEDHPSVVVLLREPQWLTQEHALEKAQKAWGAKERVETLQILNDGRSYVFRSGKLIFAVHQAPQRYEIGSQKSTDLLQRPWQEHTAWMSVDFPAITTTKLQEIRSLGSFYKMLLIYVFLCWSPNCLAVYFPMGGITVPNLGDLAGSIQWARKNGINLDFLDDK